jgi:hypothetical protein
MSFGFPRDDEGISQAIHEVDTYRKGNIIFLASAGNIHNEVENFPGRHSSVISIYATNSNGIFLDTNPRRRGRAAASLGTFGADLPQHLFDDYHADFPNVFQPGSSVATAIAAAISATMLAYAGVLPFLLNSKNANANSHKQDGSSKGTGSDDSILSLLSHREGMSALLEAMVQSKHGREWFVDPIAFWRDTSGTNNVVDHHPRYYWIHSVLYPLKQTILQNTPKK